MSGPHASGSGAPLLRRTRGKPPINRAGGLPEEIEISAAHHVSS
jgi:hypothetical protein